MLQLNFRTDLEVLRELERYLLDYEYCIRIDGRNYELVLKERPAFPWTEPKKRRLFRGHPPSSVQYEPVATAVLDYFLDQGGAKTFLDVGSESGYFSLVASSRTDRQVKAHAFEMRPESHARIRKLIEGCSCVDVRPNLMAMSDKVRDGQPIWFTRMKLFEAKPESHEYLEAWHIRLKYWLKGKLVERSRIHEIRIPVNTIDNYCDENALVPDIIKIDVEGYEGKVLRGCANSLLRHKPIVLLELHKSKHLKRTAMSRLDVVNLLFEADYSCIFFETHHDLKSAAPRLVGPEDPVWQREKTDFCLFF